MAQPAEIYVDPSIAGDSGDGLIGTPFGDLEYAIEQTTFDITNGTRLNIKAGTDEVLAAAINTAMADTGTTVAWVPSEAAPMVLQGYTTAAGDLGIGGINADGASVLTLDDHIHFIDLHMHNSGAADLVACATFCSVIRCEINDCNGIAIDMTTGSVAIGNYIHDVAGTGIRQQGGLCAFNYFANGTKDFTRAIDCSSVQVDVYRNIIKIDGTSDGIRLGQLSNAWNNSVYSAAGSGQGFSAAATNLRISSVGNNIVEGFSDTGGVGYDFSASGTSIVQYSGNAAYNNATEYNAPADYVLDSTDNETLAASAFTAASTGDFSPVDTGNVKEGSLPADFGNGQ